MSPIENVIHFLKTGQVSDQENVFYNETRDQSNARISKWVRYFQSQKIENKDSILLGAILGELTNNSFDHNLGQWDRIPGCVVGFRIDQIKKILQLAIGDRGQGIISSLQNAVGQKISPQDVLLKAFNERVSGRAPEKRGNGLKFVLKHINEKNNFLFCVTQGYEFSCGHPQIDINVDGLSAKNTTFIYIEWGLL